VADASALRAALPFAQRTGEETLGVNQALIHAPAIPFAGASSPGAPASARVDLDELRRAALVVPASADQEGTLYVRNPIAPPLEPEDDDADTGPSSAEMDRRVAEQYPIPHDELDDLDPESERVISALLARAGATPEEIEEALEARRDRALSP
jgi:hypothetical protein